MTTHCFYHSADLDGHCSGAIVKHFIPEAILHPINYGDAFPWDEIKPEDTVYMVDFCLQPATDMHRLYGLVNGNLIWIDHHKTAIDSLKGFPVLGFQVVGQASCELTWVWFSRDPFPTPVTLLGRYDVWDHSDPRTLPFQYRMRMEDMDPLKGEGAMEKWGRLFGSNSDSDFPSISTLITEGELLLRYEEQQNIKVCRAYAFETEWSVRFEQKGLSGLPPGILNDTLNCVVLNRGMTSSKIFDSVYDPEKHHLMITFCRLPLHKQTKGGWTVSLYSTRDDVDCGAIAKAFGGGGHKGAAGFQCNDLPFRI